MSLGGYLVFCVALVFSIVIGGACVWAYMCKQPATSEQEPAHSGSSEPQSWFPWSLTTKDTQATTDHQYQPVGVKAESAVEQQQQTDLEPGPSPDSRTDLEQNSVTTDPEPQAETPPAVFGKQQPFVAGANAFPAASQV
eukprot:TRINITY_DN9859_c0_g1_i2.p1 TRINITY_DN9859_c0_g1~~TRINITY_DN9859_c0_g1_i2.p1  ORF type:complete len:139 (-),score=23.58 TRINITY_DN9859_c0_g1_i2:361-777(-)